MVGRGGEEEAGAVGVLQAMRCLCVTLGNSGEGVGSACSPHLESGQGRRKNRNMGSQGPGALGLGIYSLYPSGLVCLDPEGSEDGK